MKYLTLLSTAAVVLVASSAPALAGDLEKLQAQINALQKQVNKLKEQQKTSTIDASDIVVQMKPSPKISSKDGAHTFQPFGRVQLDYGFFNDDKVDHPDGANFRRARLGFKGKVAEEWGYKFEIDFAKEGVAFKDVYLSYKGLKNTELKVGHFKPAFGLEELTSANYITFIERSSPITTFASGEIIGASARHHWNNGAITVGIHNDDAGTTSNDDEAWSLASRATLAPIRDEGRLLHLGVSHIHRSPDRASNAVRYKTKAENGIATASTVDTGTIANVDDTTLYGLEAAAIWNNVSLQAEYVQANVDTETTDHDLSGYYIAGSYFLTGESRPYSVSAGKFGRVRPNTPFSLKDGGLGAIELAARYSNIDLTDGTVSGGEMSNYTIGVNWHPVDHVRLMANYIMVDSDKNAVTANDDPSIILLRGQVDF